MYDVAKELLQIGLLGPILVAVGWYVWKLHLTIQKLVTQLREVQDARIADTQAMVDKLLHLNDKWNATVSEQSQFVETLATTLADVKVTLRDLYNDRRS